MEQYPVIDTIDYIQGIGNGPINPLHLCPKPNTFSMYYYSGRFLTVF